jgi:Icc-related predicted phosphoesterase
VKCCYASDLHGHAPHYAELLKLAESGHAGAMILGGDLLPRKGHGQASLESQTAFVNHEFRAFAERVRGEGGVLLCAILGNDDWAGTLPLFRELEAEGLMKLLGRNPLILSDGTRLMGYSFVPPTPFLLKDFEKRDLQNDSSPRGLRRIYATRNGRVEEEDEEAFFSNRTSIEEDLAAWDNSKRKTPFIYVMHSPPFGTALDRLHDGRSAGSRAVLRFIQSSRPRLTLHGHIHESPEVSGSFVEELGETLCVNPGQTGDGLSAVLFDTKAPEETIRHTRLPTQLSKGGFHRPFSDGNSNPSPNGPPQAPRA